VEIIIYNRYILNDLHISKSLCIEMYLYSIIYYILRYLDIYIFYLLYRYTLAATQVYYKHHLLYLIKDDIYYIISTKSLFKVNAFLVRVISKCIHSIHTHQNWGVVCNIIIVLWVYGGRHTCVWMYRYTYVRIYRYCSS